MEGSRILRTAQAIEAEERARRELRIAEEQRHTQSMGVSRHAQDVAQSAADVRTYHHAQQETGDPVTQPRTPGLYRGIADVSDVGPISPRGTTEDQCLTIGEMLTKAGIPEPRKEAPYVPEKVNHPDHYGGDTPYEVIKVLKAWLTPDEFIGFCKGNALKYQARHRHKGGNEDLAKAEWYTREMNQYIKDINWSEDYPHGRMT